MRGHNALIRQEKDQKETGLHHEFPSSDDTVRPSMSSRRTAIKGGRAANGRQSMKYRTRLPQLDGGLFLTDGGIETDLIFID